MRFEIRAGGAFLILAGLAGLSFVVFALGLVGGYKMAQSNSPDASPVASVYPLPNPPPSSDLAKAPDSSSAGVASVKPASVKPVPKIKDRSSTAANSAASSLSMDKDAGPVVPAPPRAIENVPPPAALPAATGPSEATTTTAPSDKYASASEAPASPARHKPYNIQIDAVMDRGNAVQMSSRLQKLGYHAFLVPTTIGGQTWWRIRVGPYNSQDEASAAEQELRAKYKDSYAPN
jgi:cell division septation protein DedD